MNPLRDHSGLPHWADIRPEHALPALHEALESARAGAERLFAQEAPRFDSFVLPLSDVNESVSRTWNPVAHLNAVVNNEALRKAYNEGLPLLSEHFTRLKQDERLFRVYDAIRKGPEWAGLSPARKKLIEDALRDFRLAGAELAPGPKKRFAEIAGELAVLQSTFSDHVLDDTNAYELLLDREDQVAGLPPGFLAMAHERAVADGKAKNGEPKWKLTLEAPFFIGFMKYAQREDLRKELYLAFQTRGTRGDRDNTPVMARILALRGEQAGLLGFRHFGDLSLETKMAESPEAVEVFLAELARRSRTAAMAELEQLKAIKGKRGSPGELQAWDLAYYSELLRQETLDIDDERVKPYFPLPRVLNGLFEIVGRLFGVRFEEETARLWHPDARLFALRDPGGDLVGRVYMDLHARPNKRGGAWMDDLISRKRGPRGLQRPAAHLVCNFSPPVGGKAALLTHEEVTTLFHEMGHVLHHLLTRVDELDLSGINGVPWDGVELPSQFLEYWAWESEGIRLISGHVDTGEPLPEDLLERMKKARRFLSGMAMLRQLEFALLDMGLHTRYRGDEGGLEIDAFVRSVREPLALVPPPPEARMQNGFTHIFAGGYAAGYYSYKWAEVLAADAFARFEERGLFDPPTGKAFLDEILSKGGSDDFLACFIRFRGRKPDAEALLRHGGLA
ncbi:MAG: M3 family metallopeptidase [Spirochaetes bacterium]|nr:M3 family metallopeptidase [Spirochaetota bacterium]